MRAKAGPNFGSWGTRPSRTQTREGTHGGDGQTQRMQKRDKATNLACIESCTRLFGSIPAILWSQL